MPKPVIRRSVTMLRSVTPVEHYPEFAIYVKREDMACLPPGPPFSKARGVFARVSKRPENIIGVLDTAHSQAGWAVARACEILGKQCINYYPSYKHSPGAHPSQFKAKARGAKLVALPAGRSAILYHAARKDCESKGGYIMPNALKLHESVTETAKEVTNCLRHKFDLVIVPASSATIAAGVIKGFRDAKQTPQFLIHLGYSRSIPEVYRYLQECSGYDCSKAIVIDEEYAYKDQAVAGDTPSWSCNAYYDLKTFRWWMGVKDTKPYSTYNKPLMWNIG